MYLSFSHTYHTTNHKIVYRRNTLYYRRPYNEEIQSEYTWKTTEQFLVILGCETHGKHVNTTRSMPIIFHVIHLLIMFNFNANGTAMGLLWLDHTHSLVCSMFIGFHIVDSTILQITITIIVNSRSSAIFLFSVLSENKIEYFYSIDVL